MNIVMEKLKWIPLEHVYPAEGQTVIASDGENYDIVTWKYGVWMLEETATRNCEYQFIKWAAIPEGTFEDKPYIITTPDVIAVPREDLRELMNNINEIMKAATVMGNALAGIVAEIAEGDD